MYFSISGLKNIFYYCITVSFFIFIVSEVRAIDVDPEARNKIVAALRELSKDSALIPLNPETLHISFINGAIIYGTVQVRQLDKQMNGVVEVDSAAVSFTIASDSITSLTIKNIVRVPPRDEKSTDELRQSALDFARRRFPLFWKSPTEITLDKIQSPNQSSGITRFNWRRTYKGLYSARIAIDVRECDDHVVGFDYYVNSEVERHLAKAKISPAEALRKFKQRSVGLNNSEYSEFQVVSLEIISVGNPPALTYGAYLTAQDIKSGEIVSALDFLDASTGKFARSTIKNPRRERRSISRSVTFLVLLIACG